MSKSEDLEISEFLSRVSRRLSQFREDSGYSREELSRRAGVSHSGIRKLEDPEQCNPTLEILFRILRGVGRTVGDFWEPWLSSDPEVADQQVQRIVARALRDPWRRDIILGFVKLLDR